MAGQGGQGQITLPQLPPDALTEANLLQLTRSTSGDFTETTATAGSAESSDDAWDTDRVSISDSSGHAEPLNVADPHYEIIECVISQLLAGYITRHQNPLPVRESGQGVVSSTSVPSCETATRGQILADNQSCLKGKRGIEDAEPSKASFACPFLEKDPIKYRYCCEKTLRDIRDVKHHLYRRHAPGLYCLYCLMTGFADQRSLQDHIDKRSCPERDPSMLEGISYDQRQQLFKKSGSTISAEEQWFVVWAVVFPESPEPASVYIDTALSMEMQLFREYSFEYGPTMLDTQEEQQQLLDRIITEGTTRVFEKWQSAQSTGA
ncbi:hypothetical protein EDB81DRAFT_950231 [Dactylonectria macrodidyma]|uniref:C2H2-type domain-containing protein n=1 Tax=Dactylonectria macrodidyma TaxID=307937 RepID=A0A9P9IRR9_9HYPO|nr:hypothetical protein EDB81DRAFT_950231 [Dactylonectria macrodidyma]